MEFGLEVTARYVRRARTAPLKFQISVTLVFGLLSLCKLVLTSSKIKSQSVPTFRVALHAQARYSEHGWVAGSEITTSGLKNAFEKHKMVERVVVFAPFSYNDLIQSGPWDFVLIEGYSGSVPQFIKRLRDAARARSEDHPPIVAHFCLDTYPSIDLISRLDVDMFFTNSHSMRKRLEYFAPSYFLELAADPDFMHPLLEKHPLYKKHNVVYLGHNSATKKNLYPMLLEAIPFGLAIYGHNWDSPSTPRELKKCSHGILPVADMSALYSSSKVVIGTTEDKQKKLGMINNRVFEVLACGTPFISDSFPALENKFGDILLYYNEPGDVQKWLTILLGNESIREKLGNAGRALILASENWAVRSQQMFDRFLSHRATLVDSHRAMHMDSPSFFHRHHLRRNSPKIAVVYPILELSNLDTPPSYSDEAFEHGLTSTLASLSNLYKIDFIPFHVNQTYPFQIGISMNTFDDYEIILVRDSQKGFVDSYFDDLRVFNSVNPGESGIRNDHGIIGRLVLLLKEDASDVLLDTTWLLKYEAVVCPSASCIDNLMQAAPHPILTELSIMNKRLCDIKKQRYSLQQNRMPTFPEAVNFGKSVLKPVFSTPMAQSEPGLRTSHGPSYKCDGFTKDENSLAEMKLRAVFDAILYSPRASASIRLHKPLEGEFIALPSWGGILVVVVDIFNFVPPRDGMWCLRVNGQELVCVGDEKFDYNLLIEPSKLNENFRPIELVPVLRDHFDRSVLYVGRTTKILVKFDEPKTVKLKNLTGPLNVERWEHPNLRSKSINDHKHTVFVLKNDHLDINRVYCRYIIPLPFLQRKIVTVGTVEKSHFKTLSVSSHCDACGIIIRVAELEKSEENNLIHCHFPHLRVHAPMLVQQALSFKFAADTNTGDQLVETKVESMLVFSGRTIGDRLSEANNHLYFETGCRLIETKYYTDHENQTDHYFFQLVSASCINPSNPFRSASELDRNKILWDSDPHSLTGLPSSSFATVTMRIRMNDLSEPVVNELIQNAGRILQEKGNLRVSFTEEKAQIVRLKDHKHFLETLIARAGLHPNCVSPMTTHLDVLSILPNSDQDGFAPIVLVCEGHPHNFSSIKDKKSRLQKTRLPD
jgi:glycosyltransferase involved in cell wall biosynthesis